MLNLKSVFVKCTPLYDVCGRVHYISSPEKQEFLVANYSTVDSDYWSRLAIFSQNQAKYNPNAVVCEAREFIVIIPYSLAELDPDELCREFADAFKSRNGVEVNVAIHWNHSRSNYHFHLIFSERDLAEEKPPNYATRNTYFDAQGKRSTKSKCTDETGMLISGCRFVPKGEDLNVKADFGTKIDSFARPFFLKNEKQYIADYFNKRIRDLMKSKNWPVEEDMLLTVYNNDTEVCFSKVSLKHGEPENLRDEKLSINETLDEYNSTVKKIVELRPDKKEELLEMKKQIQKEAVEMRERFIGPHRYIRDQNNNEIYHKLQDGIITESQARELRRKNKEDYKDRIKNHPSKYFCLFTILLRFLKIVKEKLKAIINESYKLSFEERCMQESESMDLRNRAVHPKLQDTINRAENIKQQNIIVDNERKRKYYI